MTNVARKTIFFTVNSVECLSKSLSKLLFFFGVKGGSNHHASPLTMLSPSSSLFFPLKFNKRIVNISSLFDSPGFLWGRFGYDLPENHQRRPRGEGGKGT